jgi:2-keto-myo-inositol isomerase
MSGFRYSLNTSTIRTTPLLQKISVAAAAGYSGIELWHADIDAWLTAGGTLRDLRRALDDHGLSVPTTIHLKQWFQSAGDEYRDVLEDSRRKFEQAAAVGAAFVVAGPPPDAANRPLGARRYFELMELGLSFGVRPAFEYLGFVQDIRTNDDAIDITERSGHPQACLVLDPFHCYVGGGSIESISRLTAAKVAVSHFNDAPAQPAPATQRDPDRVMPGDGAIPLRRYCELLRNIGYSGFLSLELFRPDLWERPPLEVAREGLEKMRRVAEG